jgi:hypothetical protein
MRSLPPVRADPISLTSARTLPGLFRCRVERIPDHGACCQFKPKKKEVP